MTKKIFLLICCLWTAAQLCAQTNQPMRNQVELAFPYKILTYSGISTKLNVNSTLYDPAVTIKSYKWDMYSDGKTILTTATNSCEYRYTVPGTYRTTVTALLSNGYGSTTSFTVEVSSGTGVQSQIIENKTYSFSLSAPSPINNSTLKSSGVKPKDGIVNKFALLVSGSIKNDGLHADQSRSVSKWNTCLSTEFDYNKDNIYYLEEDTSVSHDIDAPPSVEEFGRAFEAIRNQADEDDLLFIWIADHGNGYCDPSVFDATSDRVFSGEFLSRLIPNGTEKLESDIKMKTTDIWNPYTNLNSRFPGLNKWILVTLDTSELAPKRMYRIKFGNFDNDKFIEVVADYLAVDTNEDGIVSNFEFAAAKSAITLGLDNVITVDNSALWKNKHRIIIDDYHQTDHNFQPYIKFKGNGIDQFKTTVMFDNENDNKLDIAIIEGIVSTISGLDPTKLNVAGTDNDNDGLIDGVDLNCDGDKTDRFDFDENIFLLKNINSPLYASEFNDMLNSLRCKNIIIGLEACFSGGFIYHISAPGRVVITSTQDRYWGWSDDGVHFSNGMYKLLNGYRRADKNKDGVLTMLELFNHAYSMDNYPKNSLPQYNDNGDGKMNTGTLAPAFNAGCLGNILTLNGYQKTEPVISNKTVSTSTDYSGTSLTLSNVKITPTGTINLHQMTGVLGQISLSSLVIEQGGRLVIDNAFCK